MVKSNNYNGLNPIISQALINLQYNYTDETPEMWCARICYLFRTLLENNPKYFSKNGFIHMTERSYMDGRFKIGRRSFYIYCTVCDSLVFIRNNTLECANDHLKKCIAEKRLSSSNPIQKNTKKGGAPSRNSVLSLSCDEIDRIYQTYSVMYSRGLNHYSYDYSHEGRKTVAYRLFNSAKLIQQAWRTFKLRPETLAKRVWNNVRNDGTPDDKKYLGMTPHVHYSLYHWVEEKKIQLWKRLCNETYKNVSKILLQKGYVIIRGSNWTNQLKWLHNPEYYRIDKDNIEYLIRVTECEKYKVNSLEVKAMCANDGL